MMKCPTCGRQINDNIAIGYEAGKATTTGTAMNPHGQEPKQSKPQVTGVDNVFVGYPAGPIGQAESKEQ